MLIKWGHNSKPFYNSNKKLRPCAACFSEAVDPLENKFSIGA